MNNHLTIWFDGSCYPKNPGGTARYGYEIRDSEDNLIHSQSGIVCKGHGASCNLAEWAGLTEALRHLYSQKNNQSVKIYGDSKLVICQLNRQWRCNNEQLKPYLNECLKILSDKEWDAEWISRSKNTRADLLSRSKH